MAFNAGLRGRSIVMATEDFPFEEMKEFDITEWFLEFILKWLSNKYTTLKSMN